MIWPYVWPDIFTLVLYGSIPGLIYGLISGLTRALRQLSFCKHAVFDRGLGAPPPPRLSSSPFPLPSSPIPFLAVFGAIPESIGNGTGYEAPVD